jgi:SAM-dependent methyltransferase
MDAVGVFDEHAREYDRWFDAHQRLYRAEVNALGRFIPPTGLGVEIGGGSGRFAAPLGIKLGVEPSRRMAEIARDRGVVVYQAVGEALPFPDDRFDFALLVTVICFVDHVPALLRETRRVLKPAGRLILGFIDRDSPLGGLYEARKEADPFYRQARFYSVGQVANYTRQVGFDHIEFCQTVFGLPGETPGDSETQPVRDGYGEGAFVVLSAEKI